jgi:hypothetical protein
MGVCGAVALGSAAGALAANAPKLAVLLSTSEVSAPTDVTLDLAQAAGDSPTAGFTIYVPIGVSVDTTQAAGTSLGTAAITAGGGAASHGTVTMDNAANHTADACAPGTHQAVWLVTAGSLSFPIYVDPTAGAEATLGSFKLVACFGATRPTETVLTLKKVFTNPSGGNFEYAFTAVVTPYDANNQPSTPGAAFAYGIVRVPVQVSLAARYATSSGKTLVTGQVLETALLYPLPGAKVEIFGGPSASTEKSLGTVTANRKGQFIWTQNGSSLKNFHAELAPLVRNATKYDCNTSFALIVLAPAGCASASIGTASTSSDETTVKTTKH